MTNHHLCLESLISGGDEEESDKVLKLFRYKILLVSNPDGYKYSFSNDPRVRRMQRKNRRIFDNCSDFANPAGDGDGVDLNRNFDFHWGGKPEEVCYYARLKKQSIFVNRYRFRYHRQPL